MREARTDQLLDGIQEHAEADLALQRTIARAIADERVTAAERLEIERALATVETTRGRVRWHAEKLRAAIRIARSLLYTGDLTPKLQRTQRELERDLDELRPELAA